MYRQYFPFFDQFNGVFLDSAASAQKPKAMLDELLNIYQHQYCNVHRGSYPLSTNLTDRYEQTRERCANWIGAQYEEVIWTKGATESINLVANCLIVPKHKNNIVISAAEHHANLVPWQQLCLKHNLQLRVIDLKGHQLNPQDIHLIDQNTLIIALSHQSNVTGAVFDVQPFIKQAQKNDALTLIDGSQFAVHQTINVAALGCDFYVLSAHKAYGPNGVGVLYASKKAQTQLTYWQYGGEMVKKVEFQQSQFANDMHRFEAGTPVIAEVIAFAKSIDFMQQHHQRQQWETKLAMLLNQRLSTLDSVVLLSPNHSTIQSFYFTNINSFDCLSMMSDDNIAIRSGFHCANPYVSSIAPEGALRASLACYNSFDDINQFMNSLNQSLELLQP